jgi:hypothetical protein
MRRSLTAFAIILFALAGPARAAPPGGASAVEIICPLLSSPPRMDVSFEGWPALPQLALGPQSQWQPAPQAKGGYAGPEDLSGEVWLGWDASALYLAISTRDDSLRRPARAEDLSRGDLVRAEFLPKASSPSQPEKNTFLFAVLPQGALVWREAPASGAGETVAVQLYTIVRRQQTGAATVIYKAALPWRELAPLAPEAGARFSLRIALRDDDGEGPEGALEARCELALAGPGGAVPPAAPVLLPPSPSLPPPPSEAPAALPQFAQPDIIRFDQQALLIRNQETFIFSGEVPYFRLPRGEWADRLARARLAGMNAVATSVPWSSHEPVEGEFDFASLEQFLALCKQTGLWVILRIGPYLGDSVEAGGLPAWLLGKQPQPAAGSLEWAKHWFDAVLPVIGRHQITKGGPVILVQLGSEPSPPGQDPKAALRGLHRLARAAGLEIPLCTANAPAARDNAAPEMNDLLDMIALSPQQGAAGLRSSLQDLSDHENGPAGVIQLPAASGGDAADAAGLLAAALEAGAKLVNVCPFAEGLRLTPLPADTEAPISLAGALDPLYYALRPFGEFLDSFGPLLLRATPLPPATVRSDSPHVLASARANGETVFIFMRNEDGSPARSRLTFLDPKTGREATMPRVGTLVLPARSASILTCNLPIGNGLLRYCTSQLAGLYRSPDRTLLLLHGEEGTQGELALHWPSEPLVSGDRIGQNWDSETRTLTLQYYHGQQERFLRVDFLEILILSTPRARQLWSQKTDQVWMTSDCYLPGGDLKATPEGLRFSVRARSGPSHYQLLLPRPPQALLANEQPIPYRYDSSARALSFSLLTPNFEEDRGRPSFTRRLVRKLSRPDPPLTHSFSRARFTPEPISGGSGWKTCELEPLETLGLPSGRPVRYRAEFQAEDKRCLAISAYGDDPKYVFLNGRLVRELSGTKREAEADVSGFLRPGKNLLQIIYLPGARAASPRALSEPKGIARVSLLSSPGLGHHLPTWRVKRAPALSDQAPELSPGFDDSSWELVTIAYGPQELFRDYLGAAWYRAQINISQEDLSRGITLLTLDGVDDAATVYLNGQKLGECTRAGGRCSLDLAKALRLGKNVLVLAVRNTAGASGGITLPVTLTSRARTLLPISGWQFLPGLGGEAAGFTRVALDESAWHIIRLGEWRKQHGGFSDFDGPAWYRLVFRLPSRPNWSVPFQLLLEAKGEALIFLNGRLLGRSPPDAGEREFPLPPSWLGFGAKEDNLLAVCVLSDSGEGGLLSARVHPYSDHMTRREQIEVKY